MYYVQPIPGRTVGDYVRVVAGSTPVSNLKVYNSDGGVQTFSIQADSYVQVSIYPSIIM